MKKQELEELRRLEEELMEIEYSDDDFIDALEEIDEIDLLEDTWQEIGEIPVDIYNTDSVDVDMDDFSAEVQQAPSHNQTLSVVLILILLGVVVFCAMKLLGVV